MQSDNEGTNFITQFYTQAIRNMSSQIPPNHCADPHYTEHMQRISSSYATFNEPECTPDATT